MRPYLLPALLTAVPAAAADAKDVVAAACGEEKRLERFRVKETLNVSAAVVNTESDPDGLKR